MSSSHQPKNAEISTISGEKAEIFWQTQNANHIIDNYLTLVPRGTQRSHDVKFTDIAAILVGKNVWLRTKKKPVFVVLGKRGDRIYQVIVSLNRRTDIKDKLFAVVISCYICTSPEKIKTYKREI